MTDLKFIEQSLEAFFNRHRQEVQEIARQVFEVKPFCQERNMKFIVTG